MTQILLLARRHVAIGTICTLSLGLGACANMQRHMDNALGDFEEALQPRPERNKPVMPEDHIRSYEDGAVTVYPLQGPLPAEPVGRAENPYRRDRLQTSYDDPNVTVYDLDNGPQADVPPVDSLEIGNNTKQQTGAYNRNRDRAQQSFEARAGRSAASTPLVSGELEDAGQAAEPAGLQDTPDMNSTNTSTLSQQGTRRPLTDYGRDARFYGGNNTGKTVEGTDKQSPDDDEQQSKQGRLLTAP